MGCKFQAVAFDLDGTLYPNWNFYRLLLPFLMRELPLLRAMGRARTILRREGPAGDFYENQARLMAESLGADPQVIREKTERLIYRGWEPFFRQVACFPHLQETLAVFRGKGLKLGVLSDFPAAQKLENLGLGGFWDAVICSEETGALKPHPRPFLALAEALGFPPEEILYAGNSAAYDVAGAKALGMGAALISSPFFMIKSKKGADFVFYSYRQLQKYVLE
jgi:putative hydrolase of the HAD superfamily